MRLPNTFPMTVRFPTKLYEEIDRLSFEQRRTFSWIVLRTLETALLPEEARIPENDHPIYEKKDSASKDANS